MYDRPAPKGISPMLIGLAVIILIAIMAALYFFLM
jgi:hypothetical protein